MVRKINTTIRSGGSDADRLGDSTLQVEAVMWGGFKTKFLKYWKEQSGFEIINGKEYMSFNYIDGSILKPHTPCYNFTRVFKMKDDKREELEEAEGKMRDLYYYWDISGGVGGYSRKALKDRLNRDLPEELEVKYKTSVHPVFDTEYVVGDVISSSKKIDFRYMGISDPTVYKEKSRIKNNNDTVDISYERIVDIDKLVELLIEAEPTYDWEGNPKDSGWTKLIREKLEIEPLPDHHIVKDLVLRIPLVDTVYVSVDVFRKLPYKIGMTLVMENLKIDGRRKKGSAFKRFFGTLGKFIHGLAGVVYSVSPLRAVGELGEEVGWWDEDDFEEYAVMGIEAGGQITLAVLTAGQSIYAQVGMYASVAVTLYNTEQRIENYSELKTRDKEEDAEEEAEKKVTSWEERKMRIRFKKLRFKPITKIRLERQWQRKQ